MIFVSFVTHLPISGSGALLYFMVISGWIRIRHKMGSLSYWRSFLIIFYGFNAKQEQQDVTGPDDAQSNLPPGDPSHGDEAYE